MVKTGIKYEINRMINGRFTKESLTDSSISLDIRPQIHHINIKTSSCQPAFAVGKAEDFFTTWTAVNNLCTEEIGFHFLGQQAINGLIAVWANGSKVGLFLDW
ncbi:MAG: hypothetical protein CMJ19_23860 [Phycisphaeraceae bacterium]|nr:hypothetical protein [Phycisphaeraceae bacterium]